MKTTLLLVALTVGTVLGEEDSRTAAEKVLRTDLFGGYHKEVLPGYRTNVTINQMDINYIEMYEEKHRLDVHCWIHMMWKDPRLTWEASAHHNISLLYLPSDKVWKPDLTIYNGGDPDRQLLTDTTQYQLILYPNGQLLYIPSVVLSFTCIMDLTYWPHDEHNCTLKVGSWVLDGYKLDLHVDFQPNVTTEIYNGQDIGLMEWEMEGGKAEKEVKYYDCCSEPYVNFQVSFLFRRNAPAFAWLVKAPVIGLTLVSVVVFLLPTKLAGVKVILGGLLMVFDLLFLTFASDTVAHNPSHTPLLVKLVVLELVMVAISVVVSAMVARFVHSPETEPLPVLLRAPVIFLAKPLCLQTYAREASGMEVVLKPDEVELGNDSAGIGGDVGSGDCKKGVWTSQWFLLAAVVDRFALFVYLVFTLVFIAFSCVL